MLNIVYFDQLAKPLETHAYFDKVRLGLSRLITTKDLDYLRDHCVQAKPVESKWWPQELDLTRPDQKALKWIVEREKIDRGLSISFVEIAVDYTYETEEEWLAAYDFLDICLIRKWHNPDQEIVP